jgi:transposase-like protein
VRYVKERQKARQSYSPEFEAKAIELANDTGVKEATEKPGNKNLQTLAAWVRYSN